jgi:hypothetical protein
LDCTFKPVLSLIQLSLRRKLLSALLKRTQCRGLLPQGRSSPMSHV